MRVKQPKTKRAESSSLASTDVGMMGFGVDRKERGESRGGDGRDEDSSSSSESEEDDEDAFLQAVRLRDTAAGSGLSILKPQFHDVIDDSMVKSVLLQPASYRHPPPGGEGSSDEKGRSVDEGTGVACEMAKLLSRRRLFGFPGDAHTLNSTNASLPPHLTHGMGYGEEHV